MSEKLDYFHVFVVCVWDKNDRLYQRQKFDELMDALSYAHDLIEKYSVDDEIVIYASSFDSIIEFSGLKENM